MNKFNFILLTLSIVFMLNIVEAFPTKGGHDNGGGSMMLKKSQKVNQAKRSIKNDGKKKSGKGKKNGNGGFNKNDNDEINAAIFSKHIIKTKTIQTNQNTQAIPDIVIDAGGVPMTLRFKSISSDLNVIQDHENSQGSVQQSKSIDGPLILKHTVKKPILQEVHEIIMPARKIIQEIQPVHQVIKTIVSKGVSQSTPASSDYTTPEEGSTTEENETTTIESYDY